jgi:hypothetical protein
MAHFDASNSSRIPILRSSLPRAFSLLSGRQGNQLLMAHSGNTPLGIHQPEYHIYIILFQFDFVVYSFLNWHHAMRNCYVHNPYSKLLSMITLLTSTHCRMLSWEGISPQDISNFLWTLVSDTVSAICHIHAALCWLDAIFRLVDNWPPCSLRCHLVWNVPTSVHAWCNTLS